MDGNFNDEHAGKGGSYVAGEDGKRVLLSRTAMHPDEAVQEKPNTRKRAGARQKDAGAVALETETNPTVIGE